MTARRASVVIPAHDEQDRISVTLRTLLRDAGDGELEVVVVCNGCGDETADRAREVPGVAVEEITTASKVAALRHGDAVATTFPRVYLDADVSLDTAAVRALVAALEAPGVLLAGTRPRVDLSGLTTPGRWYHEFRLRLPVFQYGIIGAGVYALHARGRARFDDWPDVIGDDQFVFRLFDPSERRTVDNHHSHVRLEGDLRGIARRQVRVRRGNRQLSSGAAGGVGLPSPSAGIGAAVREVAGKPAAWPGLVIWTAVNAWVRLRVGLRPDSGGDWGPDESELRDRRVGRSPEAGR